MPTDRVMSKKQGFLDVVLSTDIIVSKHKNIKPKAPKYAWIHIFLCFLKLILKKI